jgi:hypothetical protein
MSRSVSQNLHGWSGAQTKELDRLSLPWCGPTRHRFLRRIEGDRLCWQSHPASRDGPSVWGPLKGNRLALVSAAVLLLMSGTANAQGLLIELVNGALKGSRVVERVPPAVRVGPAVRELGTGTEIELNTGAGRVSPLGHEYSPLVGQLHERYDAGLKKVSSLYDDATPQILDNVNANVGQLTQQQLESINASVIKPLAAVLKIKSQTQF